MNILVVDDEPTYRVLLEDYLRAQDWLVYTASNGEEGLKRLRETEIDFIICDVYMPAMDGLKFQSARDAMPEFAHIPLLFVSAYADEHTLLAASTSKNCGFMKKGSPMRELREWIQYLTTPPEKRPIRRPGMPE